MPTRCLCQQVATALLLVVSTLVLLSCTDGDESVSDPTGSGAVSPSPPTATTTAPSTITATTAPPSTPTDTWLKYIDPVWGFSIQYPPDLNLNDLTGPSPQGGLQARTLDFRSLDTQTRALALSLITSFPDGVNLEDWAWEFAGCPRETISPSSLDGEPAVRCTREVYQEFREPAIVSQRNGNVFLISGLGLSEDEFDRVFSSFRFQ
jgi:hypothetical protein